MDIFASPEVKQAPSQPPSNMPTFADIGFVEPIPPPQKTTTRIIPKIKQF